MKGSKRADNRRLSGTGQCPGGLVTLEWRGFNWGGKREGDRSGVGGSGH